MHYERLEHENSATLNSAALAKCLIVSKKQHENNAWYNIKWYSIKIVEHNIVQQLHNATLDSVTVNCAASKSAT